MPSQHVPVLLEEALTALSVQPGKRYLDATLGAAGHAVEILRRSSPSGRLIGADRDPAAIEGARRRLAPYRGRFELILENFRRLPALLVSRGEPRFDGILLDLGISSDQLADPSRGFSFSHPGPLDMRMDPRAGDTAATLVNTLDARDLRRLLRELGEEPEAAAIARAIVRERDREPIATTDRLAAVIAAAVSPARRHGRIHPATRSFQALRIAVNEELEALADALEGFPDLLAPGGRLAVIAFHSLEDRIVKRRFRAWEGRCTCPPRLPVCRCGAQARVRVVTRRAVRPSAAEVSANPRARSARLRAAERLGNAA